MRQMDLFGQTSSPSEAPAKTSAWLEDALGLLARGADCSSTQCESSASSSRRSSSWKTSLAYCHRTEGGTWAPSSGRWGTWGLASPGGCLTLNGSASPNAGSVCSLSAVLVPTLDVPEKYYLSARACRGILSRSERRGRPLPAPLKAALEDVVRADGES